MLSDNDYRSPNSLSVAQHVANITAIIGKLRSSGYQIILSRMYWAPPNITFNGITFLYDLNNRIRDGWAQVSRLADGSTVFIGDNGASDLSLRDPTTFLEAPSSTGGTHPKKGTQNGILGQSV